MFQTLDVYLTDALVAGRSVAGMLCMYVLFAASMPTMDGPFEHA